MKSPKRCFYCGIVTTPAPGKKKVHPPTTRTKDHQIPKCRGGSRLAFNRVIACQGCNMDKGGLTAEEYRVVIAFRNGLIAKPDVLFNAERLESLWPSECHESKNADRQSNNGSISGADDAGLCFSDTLASD